MSTQQMDASQQSKQNNHSVTFSSEKNEVFAVPTIPTSMNDSCFYSTQEICEMAEEARMDNGITTSFPHNLDPHDTIMEQHKMEKLRSSLSSSGPNLFNVTITVDQNHTTITTQQTSSGNRKRVRERRTSATTRPPRVGRPQRAHGFGKQQEQRSPNKMAVSE